MTVKKSERDAAKTCDVEDCGAWKKGESDYCRHHAGLEKGAQASTPPPEGNQNATTHGLYAVPEYLKNHFSEQQQDRYTAYFEALCSRYKRIHGREPDEFAKDRLSRVAIECVKERIADEWLSEKADETGNLLIEEYVADTTEAGEPIRVESENQILKELTALKRETRLTLKDMGLLSDPETKKAEAELTLASVLSED